MKRTDDVLLVIDVQYDFMPGGALAVPDGDAVVPVINALARRFDQVVLTQDWHPREHVSFAANHPGREPFSTLALPYGEQVLWPVHCVQDTEGAALHRDLDIPHARLVIRKGGDAQLDSYSAFVEADRTTRTGLAGYLRELGAKRVWCCGLATDYCVAWSALDARGGLRGRGDQRCVPRDRPERVARARMATDAGGGRRTCDVRGRAPDGVAHSHPI